MKHPKPLKLFSPETPSEKKPVSSRTERELDQISGVNEAPTVAIPLGQIVPLLMEAAERNRLWLSDFADETVHVDADLYEVLLAYQRLQNRDAA